MKYLIFDLYGPMASWGDTAVGEERPSFIKPTRSALIGLISSALGYLREDEDKIHELSQSVFFGIKQYSSGKLLRDFHTVQVPTSKNKKFFTRKMELEDDPNGLNTVLSKREYRTDSFCSVAILIKSESSLSLDIIKSALEEPKFILYLGRKACPLGLPLRPRFVEAIGFKQAFDDNTEMANKKKLISDLFAGLFEINAIYYWEGSKTSGDVTAQITTEVWDEVKSRKKWLFSMRHEHQYFEEQDK